MKRLFVTGTDTSVGKTTVSRALAASFTRAGRTVRVIKPIETGCALTDGELVPADALALADAAHQRHPIDVTCPLRLSLPASPEAAAQAAGLTLDLSRIDRALATLAADADLLLVEGAGGLLVPVDAATTMADLAARAGATLLVVARASLGTINHTLLTLEAARARSLPIAGVILNRTQLTAGPDEPTNPSAIERHGRIPVLGTFPHLPDGADTSNAQLADLAEANLDLKRLWEAL